MAKRNQINISLDATDMNNVNEYCRFHDITPQTLFRRGVQKLIDEDIQERRADLKTIVALEDVAAGRSEAIDDLLEMIEEDRQTGEPPIRTLRQ